ncbi:hypothetical protein LINPERHAP2_LOCUS35922 [Linum perenne]
MFESDAEVVVKALQAECHDLTEFGELVRACRAVLGRNPNFCVRFVRRVRNGVAHVFARHSSSCVTPVTGVTSPEFVDDVLLEMCVLEHEQ